MLKEVKLSIIFGFRTFHLNVPRPPEDSTAELRRRRRHGDTRHSTVPPGAPEWEEGESESNPATTYATADSQTGKRRTGGGMDGDLISRSAVRPSRRRRNKLISAFSVGSDVF